MGFGEVRRERESDGVGGEGGGSECSVRDEK